MTPLVEFWFELASTYSYPAAARVEEVAGAAGVRVLWRPFLLGPIFAAQGWNDSPFNLYPAKGRYMWRDLERITAEAGLPFRRPSRFPRGSVLAARVAESARGEDVTGRGAEPWLGELVRAVYRANFAEDRDIGERSVVAEILAGLGLPADEILARAESTEIKERLRRSTDEAAARGIFGAPSLFAAGELFWGNDRLEDAVRCAAGKAGRAAPPSPA